MKKYKAIFFDWDGTAVLSRRAPADEAAAAMRPLLEQGVKLIIVSGTTIENIAGGKLKEFFSRKQLSNLYLGLGRGAYNYCYDEGGQEVIFHHEIPEKKQLVDIHRICFAIHAHLLEKYGYETDIVFSRPNYCKIDLMVTQNRGDNLFMQEDELDILRNELESHGIHGGLQALLDLAEATGKEYGVQVKATCDAKYLEVGISDKSDNVDRIFGLLEKNSGIAIEDCAFWGDEYVGIEPGIFGSDSFMITDRTRKGDFFDVSRVTGQRPEECKALGGGVGTFLDFLREQAELNQATK